MSAVDLELNDLALPFLAGVNDLGGHSETGDEIAERSLEDPFVVAAADGDLDVASVELGGDRLGHEIDGIIHASRLPLALGEGQFGVTDSGLTYIKCKQENALFSKALPASVQFQTLTGRTSKSVSPALPCRMANDRRSPRVEPVGGRAADLPSTFSAVLA